MNDQTPFHAYIIANVADLIPYIGNARTHDDKQVAALAKSIRSFGFTNPVLIDEDDNLIAGHGRLLAAAQLKMATVPAIVVTGLDDEQRRALILADNKIALNAGWDKDLLRSELVNLSVDAQNLTGFTPKEILTMMAEGDDGHGEDDLPPEGPPITLPGDVWVLGDHRIICGDSTDPDTWAALLGGTAASQEGEQADCVWTDPPYNVNYQDGAIQNDDMEDSEFGRFLLAAFRSAYAYTTDGGAIYIAHAGSEGVTVHRAFTDSGFKWAATLIWVKNALVLGRSDYQWRHEPILYGWKATASHNWYGGRAQTTAIDPPESAYTVPKKNAIEVETAGGDTLLIEGDRLQVTQNGTSVIRVDKPSRNPDHPTMKPVALIRRQLRNSTHPGAIVVDPFAGSGSTMVAAEQLGMRARLIEFEPKFADVIVRRWQALTGGTATNRDTGEEFPTTAPSAAP